MEIDYCPKCRGIWLDQGSWTRSSSEAFRKKAHHRHEVPWIKCLRTVIAVGIMVAGTDGNLGFMSYLTDAP
jgi:hypothetical protein